MAVHNPRAYPTYIIVRLDCRIRPLIPSVFIYAIVFSSMYPSLPPSAALNLNFALAETSLSTFLIKVAVSENEVVMCPVLFLSIILTATMSEGRAMPRPVYKT